MSEKDKRQGIPINRRSFLKGVAATGAMAAVSSRGLYAGREAREFIIIERSSCHE